MARYGKSDREADEMNNRRDIVVNDNVLFCLVVDATFLKEVAYDGGGAAAESVKVDSKRESNSRPAFRANTDVCFVTTTNWHL